MENKMDKFFKWLSVACLLIAFCTLPGFTWAHAVLLVGIAIVVVRD